MLFYIGVCVGGLLVLAIIVGAMLGFIRMVADERKKQRLENMDYWDDSLRIQTRNAETFERILELLKERK